MTRPLPFIIGTPAYLDDDLIGLLPDRPQEGADDTERERERKKEREVARG
jgi:hypothetical protein